MDHLTTKNVTNPDLELGVVGFMLYDSAKADKVLELITADAIYTEKLKTVFQIIADARAKGDTADFILVADVLKRKGLLENYGGPTWVMGLTNKASGAGSIVRHCLELEEYRMRRVLIKVCTETIINCTDLEADIFETQEKHDKDMAIAMDTTARADKEWKTYLIEADQERQEGEKHKGMTGIPTGLPALDLIYGGRQKGDLLVSAGRPGMGKTGYAVTCIRAAVNAGHPTGVFSMEMKGSKFAARVLSQHSKVDLTNVMRGNMNKEQFESYSVMMGDLEGKPVYLDDETRQLGRIITKIRNWKRKYDIEYVVLDHLGWITIPGFTGNETQALDHITKTLKTLAKKEDIFIHILAQLNRSVETRGGNFQPRLSDIRASGAIEENADVIELLYRAAYYNITEYDDGRPTEGTGEINIAKHRNGKTGPEMFQYIDKLTLWSDLYASEYESAPNNTDLKPSQEFDDVRNPYPDDNDLEDDLGFDLDEASMK